jgi:hypothetical protein
VFVDLVISTGKSAFGCSVHYEERVLRYGTELVAIVKMVVHIYHRR